MDGIKLTRKLQDLIYWIRVKHVMRSDIFSAVPGTRIKDLNIPFSRNSFSCIPVLVDKAVVGLVPAINYIDWLNGYRTGEFVSEIMVSDFKSFHPEEPVITAIRDLTVSEDKGVPVVDPSTNRFLGIVCRCWLAESLLSQLEWLEDEEELHQYRASHFFDDIVSENTSITLRYEVKAKPLEYGGEIASAIRTSLYRLGTSSETVRKAAIASYEAEMNILTYANNGFFTVKVCPEWVELRIGDNGPGIPDIDKALQPGFSTAPEWARALGFGAGMGLTNIQDCSDSFSIESSADEGTTLRLRINQEVP